MPNSPPILIATIPLLPKYRYDIADHFNVQELRFNTIMPTGESPLKVVKQLLIVVRKKPLWLDLKAGQLRIVRAGYLPYCFVKINHKISVNLPTRIYFKDYACTIVDIVDGNKLIIADEPPMKMVGEGQPINILDPSLKIDGFLTHKDILYIEAAKKQGFHNYMLSFVEKAQNIYDVLALDPEANIIAKIESIKGLMFVRNIYPKLDPNVKSRIRLMAARDDLYINLAESKFSMLRALHLILEQDPQAVVASKILTSLEPSDVELTSQGDISDLNLLVTMGFRHLMLSDEICRIRKVFAKVMNAYSEYLAYLRGEPDGRF